MAGPLFEYLGAGQASKPQQCPLAMYDTLWGQQQVKEVSNPTVTYADWTHGFNMRAKCSIHGNCTQYAHADLFLGYCGLVG